MNPHLVGGAGKWCGAPLYRGALHRCTNSTTRQKIFSYPVLKGWEEDGGVPVVQKDSKSKRNIKPVDRPAMVAGNNEMITRRTERNFKTTVTKKKKRMRNKQNPKGRTGGKTETPNISDCADSTIERIQWADDHANPIMDFPECELLPPPLELLDEVDRALSVVFPQWRMGDARWHYATHIHSAFDRIGVRLLNSDNLVTHANICYVTPWVAEQFSTYVSPEIGPKLRETIDALTKHYAPKLDLNLNARSTATDCQDSPGQAATLAMMRRTYKGRALKAAMSADLLGHSRPNRPWSNGLPRMIFVGSIGDTLAQEAGFQLLPAHFPKASAGSVGRRHIWQLLSHRPTMLLGYFPENIICMTAVTSGKTLRRIDDLRGVDCFMRGVCIEPPPRERLFPPECLNLEDIDWVVVSGESRGIQHSNPFDLTWARELRDLCRQARVAFFLNQLGSNPVENGRPLKLRHAYGGDWQEWPEDLRVREFPRGFHNYRRLANAA